MQYNDVTKLSLIWLTYIISSYNELIKSIQRSQNEDARKFSVLVSCNVSRLDIITLYNINMLKASVHALFMIIWNSLLMDPGFDAELGLLPVWSFACSSYVCMDFLHVLDMLIFPSWWNYLFMVFSIPRIHIHSDP